MSEEQILQAFKNNTVSFLDELIDQFPSETGFNFGPSFPQGSDPGSNGNVKFFGNNRTWRGHSKNFGQGSR